MNLFGKIFSLTAGSLFVLAVGLFFLSGCGKNNGTSQLTAPQPTVEQSTQSESGFDQQAYQKAKDEMVADAEKEYKARANGAPLPPGEFRFPNTPEPERRIPNYLNFYCMDDHYPTYLLCEYRVSDKKCNESDEPIKNRII